MSGLNPFLMDEVELPLVRVVADLEEAGYAIDAAYFEALGRRLHEEQAQVLGTIRSLAEWPDFNPNSPLQVRQLLFERLALISTRQTPTGALSIDEKVLLALQDEHPVVPLLLRHRKLAKVLNTYSTIPAKAGVDGRLRVEFNQFGAETGRMTSSSIIQTMPKSDELALRRGFVAAPGCRIVAADFIQQELVILAAVSRDANLLQAVRTGVDLHGLAAVRVFGLDCPPQEVKSRYKAERDRVKAVQFGLIYGRGSVSLADELNLPGEEAEKLIKDYFAQFPAVRAFIEDVHNRVLRDGHVDDVFGRRRYFPDALRIPTSKGACKEGYQILTRVLAAKREAQNFLVQGAAATVTKLAMVRCHRHITAEHPRIRMVLSLHDELHFEVPEAEVGHFAGELPGLMCDLGLGRFGIDVPMAVEVKEGPTWGDLKPYTPKEERAREQVALPEL